MNKRLRNFFLATVVSGLLPFLVHAQENDAGLWASVNLEKKFSRKFSLHFSEELRFNENITELGAFFSELAGEYRYNKIFSLTAGYRFTQRRELDDSYSIRHRYLVSLNIKNKFNKLSTNVRIRYQSQYADVNSSEDGKIPENYIRTKLTLKYNTGKKYTPYASGEIFIHTNRPDGILLDNYRVAAGIEYEFNKRSSIELGYLINGEVQVAEPVTSYVINVSWNYILK